MTTRAKVSGEWAGYVRARGVGLSRPAARERSERATDAGRLPASRRPVVARRYAVSGTALSRSVRVTRPTVPKILYRPSSQSRARLRRVGAPHRRPLSSDLARQTHWHLSGWTGQTRGRAVRTHIPQLTLDSVFSDHRGPIWELHPLYGQVGRLLRF